jgi:hypothetical protein
MPERSYPKKTFPSIKEDDTVARLPKHQRVSNFASLLKLIRGSCVAVLGSLGY